MKRPQRRGAADDSRWVDFIALGFGSGAAPVAPGTFGTLMGVALYLALRELPLAAYALIVAVMFAGGIWICDRTERRLRRHDHPAVVWDEITAFQIVMFAAPPGAVWIVYGFGLFRLFDIWKPWPIRSVERRVHGGLGTMLDDVLAAFYGLLILQLTFVVLSID